MVSFEWVDFSSFEVLNEVCLDSYFWIRYFLKFNEFEHPSQYDKKGQKTTNNQDILWFSITARADVQE